MDAWHAGGFVAGVAVGYVVALWRRRRGRLRVVIVVDDTDPDDR